jgi:hypothetical protein
MVKFLNKLRIELNAWFVAIMIEMYSTCLVDIIHAATNVAKDLQNVLFAKLKFKS